MSQFIGYGIVALVVLSPLLRRLYIERFWVHARGTVLRMEGGINTNPGAGGAWVWTPVIEYEAGGRRLNSRVAYWQRLNARSTYAASDAVDILYDPRNPARVMLDSWTTHIVFTILIGGFIAERLAHSQ